MSNGDEIDDEVKELFLHPSGTFILDTVDWGIAAVQNKTIFYFPSETSEELLATNWSIRHVQIIGYVCAPTEVEIAEASEELTGFVAVQEDMEIHNNGYRLTFFPTQRVRFATDERNDNEIFRRFQITGICIDPQWHRIDDGDDTIPATLFEVQN
jgi:hypothetical protein